MKILLMVLLVSAVLGGGMIKNSNLPRGIRNNNPGNIRRGPRWQGLSVGQSDAAFAVFTSPEYGLRALAITLRTYQQKYGIRTIRGAIMRYAPAVENDTGAYIDAVARHVGASPDAPLDFTRRSVIIPMMEAITLHENGQQPYSSSVFASAADLAGVA